MRPAGARPGPAPSSCVAEAPKEPAPPQGDAGAQVSQAWAETKHRELKLRLLRTEDFCPAQIRALKPHSPCDGISRRGPRRGRSPQPAEAGPPAGRSACPRLDRGPPASGAVRTTCVFVT